MLAGDAMRHTQLINYALYQGGWFACVLGASWQHPWVGLAIALVLIGARLTLSCERLVECRLVILATIV